MTLDKYTNNEIILDTDYFFLNKFNDGIGKPIMIVPPFAGRGGEITQNLIDKCCTSGRPVYNYELKSASHKTNDLSIMGLVDILSQCYNVIHNNHGVDAIDWFGCCQGGWLSTVHTVLYPERVSRLALFAAPINTQTGCGNAIEKYCQESISLPYHKLLVAMNGGVQPGMAQWMSFALMNPIQIFYDRYVKLWGYYMNKDQENVTKWYKNNGWYDSYRDLAGVWFLDALENHFVNNKLFKGTWNIGGHIVDPRTITCPVYVFAGKTDDITSIQQASDILSIIASKEKYLTIFPRAGHTKTFTGKEELDIFFNMLFKYKEQ